MSCDDCGHELDLHDAEGCMVHVHSTLVLPDYEVRDISTPCTCNVAILTDKALQHAEIIEISEVRLIDTDTWAALLDGAFDSAGYRAFHITTAGEER